MGKRGTLELGLLMTIIIALTVVGLGLYLSGQMGQAADEKD